MGALELHHREQIRAELFTEEEGRLAQQIEWARAEQTTQQAADSERDDLAEEFDQVAALLATLDVEAVWAEATPTERRMLVEDLIEAVIVHPDHLWVAVVGAPPLYVTLAEVGLRASGTRNCVSEGRSTPGVHTPVLRGELVLT